MEKEPHTARRQDTLLHWETLLITASHDLENITFKLLNK